jgi:DNA-binding response OmpR family regulator
LNWPIKPNEPSSQLDFRFPASLLSPQMAFRQKGIVHGMVPQNPNADRTILFAEDEGPVRKFVVSLLTQCGYNLIVAEDGKEALQKAHDHAGIIHLLLSDVEMPGMTGIKLAIQLNRERPETKILLISGLASGMLVLNNGWQFLPKPFMADMLKDRIRDCLSEQPPIKEHLPEA